MVTIADVAKSAGVSVATVSRVMNGGSLVAEPTAKLVRDTIERLSYVPNQQARNLRRNESRMILVLLPNITNPYYANVFAGINEKAQAFGYSPFLCNTDGNAAETMLQEAIDCKRADGAILLQINYYESWIEKYSKRFPLVQCCEYAENCNVPHVSIDNYKAGYEATSRLISLGHRKIGTISSTNRVASTIQRHRGYLDALKDAGITPNPDYSAFSDDDYSYPSSLHAARTLLSQPDRPEALFCISDAIALGAVIVAGELGLRVPEDVSIIGFDDVIYTKMLHPYLSTVIQPCAELGRRAMEMLHAIITTGELENREVVLPYGFIERESTGKPSAAT